MVASIFNLEHLLSGTDKVTICLWATIANYAPPGGLHWYGGLEGAEAKKKILFCFL